MSEVRDGIEIKGRVHVVLTGPDGKVKSDQWAENIVTQIGRRYYAGRASGVAGAEGQVTGMKLGQDSATAAAATGAGAALVTYIAGSQKAIDGGFPTEGVQGSGSRVTWQASWAAGVATNADIEEVVIVNDTLADATSVAADTISRAIITQVNKAAGDTLTVTWQHDIG